MKNSFTIRFALFLVLALSVLLVSVAPSAAAQGCAMCYQNASASGPQGAQALRHGILILMLPTLSLFIGIFALIYHRRNVAR
ncbi:MAG: hypothetical protein ABSF40_04580 [Candidatus Acidiferrales bacterium]|jgi:hypothetical protein